MAPNRRLPVLQNDSADEEDRPAWHWTGIGTLFVFCVWGPLSILAMWMARSALRAAFGELTPDEMARRLASAGSTDRLVWWVGITAPPIVTYAFACWAAGALVGRFGGKAGPKEARAAGAISAVVACVFALKGTSPAFALAAVALLLPLGMGGGWLGGRFGLARRRASATRVPPPAAH